MSDTEPDDAFSARLDRIEALGYALLRKDLPWDEALAAGEALVRGHEGLKGGLLVNCLLRDEPVGRALPYVPVAGGHAHTGCLAQLVRRELAHKHAVRSITERLREVSGG